MNLELPNTTRKEKKYQQNTDCLEIGLWLFVAVSAPKVLLPIMKRIFELRIANNWQQTVVVYFTEIISLEIQ
jgi:hypothetical protein